MLEEGALLQLFTAKCTIGRLESLARSAAVMVAAEFGREEEEMRKNSGSLRINDIPCTLIYKTYQDIPESVFLQVLQS